MIGANLNKIILKLAKEEINRPLHELTANSDAKMDIDDMDKYSKIFFALEHPLYEIYSHNALRKDKQVFEAFEALEKDFDSVPKESLADVLATSVKETLAVHNKTGGHLFSKGEVLSCVCHLEKIAKSHKNRRGDGYLYWVKTFFERGLPENELEMLDYIYESGEIIPKKKKRRK